AGPARPASARPPRPAAASRAGGVDAAAAQFLRASLLHLLGEHFAYPWIARRRGWEGEVRLALRVGAAGRVSDLRVVKTSGYAILDRAALRSARRIRVVPEAARWLRGRHLDIVVPVEYRLVNG
ncbi:MAG TPA: energy transducer TonB, partial [Chromatiales bacterium]|nr:energy transducer TonB [Chromatiales bacterium]